MPVLRDDRGLTMIELLAALIFIAFLAVVALPRLEQYEASRNLKQAARQLGGDVRLAQQYAITQDEKFRLVYTASPSGYTIQKVSDSSVVKQADLPPGITVSGSLAGTPVEYGATGAPTASGQFCLSDGVTILKVDVQPATGRVGISEDSSCS